MQVGQIAGIGTPRVDNDDFHLRTSGFCLLQAAKQYRMCVGHIAADDHHAIAQLQVFIAARRRIGAQASFVADHGRGHAQPRIAVDIVGAHQRPGQFVEGVVILGQQLPRDIKRHAVGAVLGDGGGEHIGRVIKGAVPVAATTGQCLAQAQLRVQRTGIEVAGQVQGRAFAAQLAIVGRMRRIAADAENTLAIMFDQHAAADPAVAAGGGGDLAAHQPASRRANCTRPFSTRA